MLASTISVLSLAQLICCSVSVYWNALPINKLSAHQINLGRTMFRVWLVLCIAADVTVSESGSSTHPDASHSVLTAIPPRTAASLSMMLNQCRSSQQSTDSTLSRIFWVIVPGGLLSIVVTMGTLAIELFSPSDDYYSFLLLCLSKIYGISIIICLNLRLQYEVRPNWLPNVLDTDTPSADSGSVMSDSAERFGWLRSNNPCLAHSIAGAGNGVVSVNQQAAASNSNLLPMLRGSHSIGAQTQLAQQQQGIVHPYHLPSPGGQTPNEVDSRHGRDSASTLIEPPSPPAVEDVQGNVPDGDIVEKLKHDGQDDADADPAAHRRSKSLSSMPCRSFITAVTPRPLLLVNTAALHRRRQSKDQRDSDSSRSHASGSSSRSSSSPLSTASSYRTPSPKAASALLPYVTDGDVVFAPSLTFTPIDNCDNDDVSPTSKLAKRRGRIFECVDLAPPQSNSNDTRGDDTRIPSRHTFGCRRGEDPIGHCSQGSLTSTSTTDSTSDIALHHSLDSDEADVTSQALRVAEEQPPQVAPLALVAATSYCESSDLTDAQHPNSLAYCSMFSAATMPVRPPPRRHHRSELHRRSNSGVHDED